ncbi:MAG: hypothetical protein FRX48_00994 [Lasallia pustulata]|uniref:Uncharacterized protein n=1 Tax=Lasallia pustulata TaxID=136370 RepID=A0A5M8Q219_9LECA|nr:MAG: hypothetical protein FRX48_00994 [Lasallia pustulata]
MASQDPDPLKWTLRFKQHKTTILLFVDQAQSFASIKKDLLEAITKAGRTELNGQTLPIDPEDVLLGVPVEKNDLSKGWVRLDITETEVQVNGNSKKIGGKKSVLNSSPLGAGLRDGAMLAFRFKTEGAMVDEDGLDVEDDAWDVLIPSYEEEYGSQ